MSYVICDKAGKYPQCTACPNAKPQHEHKIKAPCPKKDPAISFLTKIQGKLLLVDRKWRFRTTEKMIINVPVINKTARAIWDSKNEHKKKCWAWIAEGEIEILRFVDK